MRIDLLKIRKDFLPSLTVRAGEIVLNKRINVALKIEKLTCIDVP